MGYTRLWSEIVTSSIWSEDDKVRIMWITLLASADSTGFVAGSVPGMAAVARLSDEDARHALKVLESPDPDSRSREFQGRRIERVDDMGGWLILNYQKFRERISAEERRDYMRQYMRRRRDQDREQRAKEKSA